jgi:hypothetical protein
MRVEGESLGGARLEVYRGAMTDLGHKQKKARLSATSVIGRTPDISEFYSEIRPLNV